MGDEKNCLNCLVLGKSGSGKSALLNYLVGRHVAETGSGDAVTPKSRGKYTGIYPIDPVDQGDYQLFIYDSWGIEADKSEEWKRIVDNKVYLSDCRLDVREWFHAALYCIDGKRARLESYEIESIIKPLLKKGIGITFVLTKADIASEKELEGLKALLRTEIGDDVLVCEVCSEEKKLRGGKVKSRFGSQAVFSSILFEAKRNLAQKMGQSFDSYLDGRLEEWRTALLKEYSGAKIRGRNLRRSSVEELAKSRLDEVMSDIPDVYRALQREVFYTYAAMYGLALWRVGSDGYQHLGTHAFGSNINVGVETAEITLEFLSNIFAMITILYPFIRQGKMEGSLDDNLSKVGAEFKQKLMEVVNRDVRNFEEKVEKASADFVIAL